MAIFRCWCKDCGNEFLLPEAALVRDRAVGLSDPERCYDCRPKRRKEIKEGGAIFDEPPRETDPSKRCTGKTGLAFLRRLGRSQRERITYDSVPPDLPLRFLNNPTSITSEDDARLAAIYSRIARAAEALVRNLEDPNGTRVSVIVAPTGTGKSTWVPYRLLKSRIGERGRICVTQPRTITLKRSADGEDEGTIPGFIATNLLRAPKISLNVDGVQQKPSNIGCGQEVGYRYSGDRENYDRHTKLLFVTDGTVINWILSGEISQFDVLVIDEAHEQSANMELIFALLKYRLPLFPRLKVVIASATIQVDRFVQYFGDGDPNAVFVAKPDDTDDKTRFPITKHWLESFQDKFDTHLELDVEPRKRQNQLPDAVASVVEAIVSRSGFARLADGKGDILIFLPTTHIVERCAIAIEELELAVEVVHCHAQLKGDKLKSFRTALRRGKLASDANRPTSPQQIYVATNYAETSVTIPNLRFIIDSGLVFMTGWDPSRVAEANSTVWHSQAGCKQRFGRVGREREGEVFCLYSEAQYASFPQATPPELQRSPLDIVLLRAKAAGIENLDSFRWLSWNEDSEIEFQRAHSVLQKRGMLDKDGDVTNRGVELVGLQVSSVDLAYCLSEADTFGCTLEMCSYLAFLESRQSNLFVRNMTGAIGYSRWRQSCFDDLEFCLRLLWAWSNQEENHRQEWAESQGIEHDTLRQVVECRKRLLRSFERGSHTSSAEREINLNALHRVRLLLAASLPEWAYVRSDSPGVFRPFSQDCPCAENVVIDRDSVCAPERSIDAFVCLRRGTNQNSVFAQHIIRVFPEWLMEVKNLGPVARAFMLKQWVVQHGREREVATVHSIQFCPEDTVGDIPVERVCSFQVIRSLPFESRMNREFICTHTESGSLAIVKPLFPGLIRQGDVIRGIVDADEPKRSLPVVTQNDLIHRLNGTSFKGRVTDVYHEQTDDAVLAIRLDDGMEGRLRYRDIEFAFREQFNALQSNDEIEVCVIKGPNWRPIRIVTPAVAESLDEGITVGQEFTGVVAGFDMNQRGHRVAAFVELLPAQNGRLELKPVNRNFLQVWGEGDEVPVVIHRIERREIRLKCKHRFDLAVRGFDVANNRLSNSRDYIIDRSKSDEFLAHVVRAVVQHHKQGKAASCGRWCTRAGTATPTADLLEKFAGYVGARRLPTSKRRRHLIRVGVSIAMAIVVASAGLFFLFGGRHNEPSGFFLDEPHISVTDSEFTVAGGERLLLTSKKNSVSLDLASHLLDLNKGDRYFGAACLDGSMLAVGVSLLDKGTRMSRWNPRDRNTRVSLDSVSAQLLVVDLGTARYVIVETPDNWSGIRSVSVGRAVSLSNPRMPLKYRLRAAPAYYKDVHSQEGQHQPGAESWDLKRWKLNERVSDTDWQQLPQSIRNFLLDHIGTASHIAEFPINDVPRVSVLSTRDGAAVRSRCLPMDVEFAVSGLLGVFEMFAQLQDRF